MSEVTRILSAIDAGDPRAAEQLLPLVYDELRRLAAHQLAAEKPGQTLQATALVHEAYLRLVGQQPQDFSGRSHFLALAANVMRQILVDHHRERGAKKRGGDWQRVSISVAAHLAPATEIDFVALEEALELLAKMDERQARVVELRFFADLTVEEIADVLKVSKSTVEMDWRHARAWLKRRLEAAP